MLSEPLRCRKTPDHRNALMSKARASRSSSPEAAGSAGPELPGLLGSRCRDASIFQLPPSISGGTDGQLPALLWSALFRTWSRPLLLRVSSESDESCFLRVGRILSSFSSVRSTITHYDIPRTAPSVLLFEELRCRACMTAGLSDCVVELQRPKLGLRRGFNPVEERWKQEDVALPLLPAPRKVDQTWLSFTIVTQRGGRLPGSLGFSAAAPPAPPSPSGPGRGGHR